MKQAEGTMIEGKNERERAKGFAADKWSLEFDSRVLGNLVLPLIV